MSDELDAFGRKKDEAGLGDLGWGSSGDAKATPNPAPSASPNAPVASTPPAAPPAQPLSEFRTVTPASPGLRRPGRNPAVVLIQLVVLAAIAGAIFLAVSAGHDATNSARDAINSFKGFNSGGGGSGSGGGGSSKVPAQVKARDLFTPSGLRAALKILEKEQPGKITNFSMRRDRVDIQVARGGKTRIIDFPSDAEVPDVETVTSSVSPGDKISYEELNVTAPARLMRAADARLNKSPADVDYFVASKFAGALQWGVYYKGGNPIAQGDSRGRYLRRIS